MAKKQEKKCCSRRCILYVFGVIFLIYSASWNFSAEKFKQFTAESIAEPIYGIFDDSQLPEEAFSVSGFPFNINVQVDANGIVNNEGKKIEMAVPFSLKAALFSNQIHASFPAGVFFGDAETGALYRVTSDDSLGGLVAAINLDKLLISKIIFPGNDSKPIDFVKLVAETIKVFHPSGSEVLTANNVDVKIDTLDEENSLGRRVTINTEKFQLQPFYKYLLQNSDAEKIQQFNDYISDYTSKTDDVSLSLDFEFDHIPAGTNYGNKLPSSGFDVAINKLEFGNDKYAVNFDGKFQRNAGDLVPEGWFRLNVENYKSLLLHIANLSNLFVDAGVNKIGDPGKSFVFLQLDEILPYEVDAFNKWLSSVGALYHENSDIMIQLDYERAHGLKIAGMPLKKALGQYKEHVKTFKNVPDETSSSAE